MKIKQQKMSSTPSKGVKKKDYYFNFNFKSCVCCLKHGTVAAFQ